MPTDADETHFAETERMQTAVEQETNNSDFLMDDYKQGSDEEEIEDRNQSVNLSTEDEFIRGVAANNQQNNETNKSESPSSNHENKLSPEHRILPAEADSGSLYEEEINELESVVYSVVRDSISSVNEALEAQLVNEGDPLDTVGQDSRPASAAKDVVESKGPSQQGSPDCERDETQIPSAGRGELKTLG